MLLEATIRLRTKPDSRTRLEICKVYARLANHVGLEGGVEGLGHLRGHYEPKERTLLSDVEILELLDALRGTRWFGSVPWSGVNPEACELI